ncbi:MAG: amidohydrolase family protein [Pyrinomonadaceae bacterium]|nr:amidohydrolase family protein [Pyrinomonadaceae bacterium]
MKYLSILCASLLVLASPIFSSSFAQVAQQAQPGILFQNVRIFDGKSSTLSAVSNVLIKGNRIEKISTSQIPSAATGTVTVIDGRGMTLMPGLIDNHWHSMMVRPTPPVLLTADVGYLNLLAGADATATLMRGFTTVRDLGGPSFGLKRAIDEGVISGPRIFPSGAIITVTSGHGDFRMPFEVPRSLGATQSRGEQLGAAMIADSPDEVRVRVREQLMLGASQIKLTAGGGVASPHSPLDATTFTEAELRAAVEAAENWGTYVAVHAYTPASIQRAIAAGVKCIDHGHLMDEPTAKLIADKGIWLSMQALPDELAEAFPPGSFERAKAMEVFAGTDRTYLLAKKYKIKTAFGTDILFSPRLAPRHGELLTKLVRWYTPAEVLSMATGTNAQLLLMSGKRNPYPGKLGVVEEDAFADLLLVKGDPLANIKLIEDPTNNFVVIMKDGKVYKNTLAVAQTALGQSANPDMHNSRNSLDWATTYQGTTPCADCPGIKTILTLSQNGTYLLSTQYIDRDKTPSLFRGKFTWDKNGSVITLDNKGGSRRFRVGEGQLTQLSADGTGSSVAVLTESTAVPTPAGSAQTLEGNRWTLTSATTSQNNTIEMTKERPVVFTFEEGMLNVQGPCNLLSGSFSGGGSTSLVVGPMRSTRRACEPAVMSAESKLAAMLAGPLQVVLNSKGSRQLRLVSAAKETLFFDGEATPESVYGPGKIIFLEIAARRVSCNNPTSGETTCLQMRERQFDEKGLLSGTPGAWRPLYEKIEGFTHIEGHRNVVRLKSFTRPGSESNLYVLDLIVETETVN